VQLPANLTKICSYVFAKCHELVNLRLPESVSRIEENAFSECVSLEQIIIPKNIKAVGRDAFYNCSQLKSVTIPRWMEQSTSNFFTGSCHPTEISYHDNGNIVDKDGLLISIDRGAIISCLPGVASEITIPKEVKVISTNAFKTGRVRKIVILHPIVLEPGALSGVSHVQILDSVYTSDPNDTFLKLAPILKEIIDKNGVVLEKNTRVVGGVYNSENYDERNFSRAAMTPWNHGNLLDVAIGRLQNPIGLSEDARKKYEKYIAVRRKRAIDLLDWQDRLEELPLIPKVFITKYNIDDLLERAAKKNLTQLVAFLLDYKKNVLKIDPSKEASAELTLDRTKTLRELQEDWIFTNLGQPELTIKGYRGEPQTTVVLPTYTNKKPITRLSDHCDGFRMDELIIPEGYTVIETRAMQNQRSPRIVHMADSVIEIGYKAFCEAVKLEEIRLSNRLTRIEDRTFQGCVSLTKVNIPSSLKFIGKAAFTRCFSLELLVFSDNVVEIGPEAFFDCPKLVIHAPKDSYVFKYAKHYGIKLVEI